MVLCSIFFNKKQFFPYALSLFIIYITLSLCLRMEPQLADVKVFEGEGGGYYSWSTSKSLLLSQAKVGAGKLVLQPRGFALPHYADSAKIGYVHRGICTVGMISPNTSQEKVLIVKEGDTIPVPLGAISWWFNGGDTQVTIIFLGETSKARIPGQFTYFFVAGALGILGGFSTQFIQKAYNLNQEDSETLTKSQTGILLIKLEEGIVIPQPSGMEMGKVGLSANFVKLNGKGVFGPRYTTDGSVQVVYVTRGSGRIEIVGSSGKSVLDAKVKEGDLFIVPSFFAAAKFADGGGLECFSVVTSSEPIFGELVGDKSVWKALSPEILQASLGVSSEFAKKFKSNFLE